MVAEFSIRYAAFPLNTLDTIDFPYALNKAVARFSKKVSKTQNKRRPIPVTYV